jgi:hypothetical protein
MSALARVLQLYVPHEVAMHTNCAPAPRQAVASIMSVARADRSY